MLLPLYFKKDSNCPCCNEKIIHIEKSTVVEHILGSELDDDFLIKRFKSKKIGNKIGVDKIVIKSVVCDKCKNTIYYYNAYATYNINEKPIEISLEQLDQSINYKQAIFNGAYIQYTKDEENNLLVKLTSPYYSDDSDLMYDLNDERLSFFNLLYNNEKKLNFLDVINSSTLNENIKKRLLEEKPTSIFLLGINDDNKTVKYEISHNYKDFEKFLEFIFLKFKDEDISKSKDISISEEELLKISIPNDNPKYKDFIDFINTLIQSSLTDIKIYF